MGRQYDSAERRKANRQRREKGCHVYIPAAELHKAGFKEIPERLYYRTFGTRSHAVLVRLYETDSMGRR